MNNKISVDPYDDIPTGLTRRGAHRAPKRARSTFVKFAWAALATGFLVTVGIGGLVFVSDTVSLKDLSSLFAAPTKAPTPTAAATAPATLNPALLVNVLNATTTPGLASTVGESLVAAGWQVGTGTNASQTVANTVVYYGNPSLEGAARGILATLGTGKIELTDAYIQSSAQLTVVLGSDYLTPGTASPTPAAT